MHGFAGIYGKINPHSGLEAHYPSDGGVAVIGGESYQSDGLCLCVGICLGVFGGSSFKYRYRLVAEMVVVQEVSRQLYAGSVVIADGL